MLNDLRLVVRELLRHPGFSLVAIITLALGIGANAAIFSVVDHVVLNPMPYPDGERMRYLWMKSDEKMGGFMVTPSLAFARDLLSASPHVFERAELYEGASRVTQGADGAETTPVLYAQPPLFALLDGRPRLGRTLVADDLRSAAPNVAVITSEVWKTRFGGDANVLERDIKLDDDTFRIVGVMRSGFRVPGEQGIILPLRPDPRDTLARRVTVLGVLRPGMTTEAATTELRRIVKSSKLSDAVLTGFQPTVIETRAFSDTMRRSSLVLLGAVGLLLMIACANVAALLVTRNTVRAREIAIRRALGASRGRLVRLHLLESLALGLIAGIAGVLVARWMLEVVGSLLPPRLLSASALHINTTVLAFTAGVSLLTSVLFGLLPAIQGTCVDLTATMRGDARSGGTTRGRQLTRRVLIAAEIALAVMLLVGSGLLIRSFVQLQRIPLGFEPEGTLAGTVVLPKTRYATPDAPRQFFDRLLEEARALPGVSDAARATGLPPSTGLMFGDLKIEGKPDASLEGSILAGSSVSDGYFSLMRIPLRRGRTFGPQDVRTSDRVAIVNEGMARRFWPGEDPIGRRLAMGGRGPVQWTTIVGIVGDVKASGIRGSAGDCQLYLSVRQSEWPLGSIVLRTAVPPQQVAALLRAKIAELDPMLPPKIATGEERVAQELATDRFNLVLLGLFAGVGLVLSATGIYGMMALYVAHRRHEIGVRLALGATPRAVARLILRQSLGLSAAGLAAGAVGAFLAGGLLKKLLYEVRPSDPATFVSVVVVIGLVAVLASLIPLRRAVRIEPATALRDV
jgi:putative ABC transport system permease protein